MSSRALVLAVLALSGCAHRSLSGSNLDRVVRPAFVARIDENAGPKSVVFRSDGSYKARLKRLDAKEADRRLQVKLQKGMSRFQVSDRLRASTLALLPRNRPWTSTVDPVQVASALESFLVEEVPANPPDYELLRPLGADAVIEMVVEDYGMRSEDGKAGSFVVGYGRMFFLDGGEVWRRSFRADQLESGGAGIDPFKVAKEPDLYRNELSALLDAVAEQFARDLNPPDRRAAEARESSGADDVNRAGKEQQAPSPPNEEDPL